jgi:CubicO group peptidase (beta-lactamase class C family)
MSHVLIREGAVVTRNGAAADVPWWSFSKTVIAAAALALVRDGRLVLDEPLPDRPYTLRQLLQHRAGLAEYGRLPAYHEAVGRNEDAWPADEMLARTAADRLVYEPGKGWGYSNIGYYFIRRLIEQTTGHAFGDAFDDLVLKPLGIVGVRFAADRAHYSPEFDPRWVYHGLLVGPIAQAALLLQRPHGRRPRQRRRHLSSPRQAHRHGGGVRAGWDRRDSRSDLCWLAGRGARLTSLCTGRLR